MLMKIQSTVTEHVNRGKQTYRFRFFDLDNVIQKTEDGKKIQAPITVAMSARSYSDIAQARAAIDEFSAAFGKSDQPELVLEKTYNAGFADAKSKYIPIIVLFGFVAVAMTVATCSVLFGWL